MQIRAYITKKIYFFDKLMLFMEGLYISNSIST